MNVVVIIVAIVLLFDSVVSIIYFSSIFKRDKAINKTLEDIQITLKAFEGKYDTDYAKLDVKISSFFNNLLSYNKHMDDSLNANNSKIKVVNEKLGIILEEIKKNAELNTKDLDALIVLLKDKFNFSNELMIDNLRNLIIKLDKNVENTDKWCSNVAQNLAEIQGGINDVLEKVNKAKSSSSKAKTTKSSSMNTESK